MIKDILKKANRYDDIRNNLNMIIRKDDISYPVVPYINNGKTNWIVDGQSVRDEANKLLILIDAENYDYGKSLDDFLNLLQYVKTKSDVFLHNYAVSISHRKEPKIDMEIIRTWEILENLIYCLDDENWFIPEGWKKDV